MRSSFLVLAVIGLASCGSLPRAQGVGFGIGTNDWAGGAPPGAPGLAPHGSSLHGPLDHGPHEPSFQRTYGGGEMDPLGSSFRLPSISTLSGPHGAATREPAKPAVFESFGMPYHTMGEGMPLTPHGLPVHSLQGMPLPGPSFREPREAAYVNVHGYPGFQRSLESPVEESIGNEPFRFAPIPSPPATPNWPPAPPEPTSTIDPDTTVGPGNLERPDRPAQGPPSFFCMAPARSSAAQETADRVVDSRSSPRPFTAAWYASHPKAWRMPGAAAGVVADFTVTAAAAWLGTRPPVPFAMLPSAAPPAASDPGAARRLIGASRTEVSSDGPWMLLGAFTIAPNGDSSAARMICLAVVPSGVVRGVSYNPTSDDTRNIRGAVDKTDLRIAWTVDEDDGPVFQTSLAEFVKPDGTVTAFFPDGRFAPWRINALAK